jgi:hypothetical protein
MGFFGFGKSYTRDDLDREIAILRDLYVQSMGNKSLELKRKLAMQLDKVLEVCRKGGFDGSEMVEWPAPGQLTSLRNVTPEVQIVLELW